MTIYYIYTWFMFHVPRFHTSYIPSPPISTLSRQRNAATSSASWRTSRRSCLAPIRRWERINCGYVGDILDIYIYALSLNIPKYTIHRFIGWYLHYVSILRICGYCTVRDIQWYIYIPWYSKTLQKRRIWKNTRFFHKTRCFQVCSFDGEERNE